MLKRELNELWNALHHLERGLRHLRSDRHAFGALREGHYNECNPAEYVRKDGQVFVSLDREIGSDLCGFDFAKRSLERLIESASSKARS